MITIYLLFISFCFTQENSSLQKVLLAHKKVINIEKLKEIHSLEMNGYVEFYLNDSLFNNREPNLSGEFRESIVLPNQRYYESRLKGVEGSYIESYNKGELWHKDGGGYSKSPLNKTAALIYEQRFDVTPHLDNYEKKGFSSSYEGKKSIDGNKFHCIKLSHENGDTHYYCLDTKSYLVKIISFMQEGKDNENWTKRYFYNYKIVYGIMIPHAQYDKLKYGGNITTTLCNYTDIKINSNIDPSIFDMPEN